MKEEENNNNNNNNNEKKKKRVKVKKPPPPLTVRFDDKPPVVIEVVPNRADYSPSEREALWYSTRDLMRIQCSVLETLCEIEKERAAPHVVVSDNNKKYIRGLEPYLLPDGIRIELDKKRHHASVLNAQSELYQKYKQQKSSSSSRNHHNHNDDDDDDDDDDDGNNNNSKLHHYHPHPPPPAMILSDISRESSRAFKWTALQWAKIDAEEARKVYEEEEEEEGADDDDDGDDDDDRLILKSRANTPHEQQYGSSSSTTTTDEKVVVFSINKQKLPSEQHHDDVFYSLNNNVHCKKIEVADFGNYETLETTKSPRRLAPLSSSPSTPRKQLYCHYSTRSA